MSESCSIILGKALLWFVYSPNNFAPQDFCNGSNMNYKIVCAAGVANNPVKKVPIIVSGDEGSVFIEVVVS